MASSPFIPVKPRKVQRPKFPKDLKDFFATNEGIGRLEVDGIEHPFSICKLDEVRKVGQADILVLRLQEDVTGWDHFEGLRIGLSSFGDDIVYVLQAPCCPAGSILTLGPDVAGPGGIGDQTLECSLVLASSFADWIKHLEENGWTEYGLVPGGIAKLPAKRRTALRRYYHLLNPQITWGAD